MPAGFVLLVNLLDDLLQFAWVDITRYRGRIKAGMLCLGGQGFSQRVSAAVRVYFKWPTGSREGCVECCQLRVAPRRVEGHWTVRRGLVLDTNA